MRHRVEFRLSMPGVASWNGKWSGEGKNHVLVRSLDAADIERLGIGEDHRLASWHHGFGDGWAARVSARIMGKGERAAKSDGFCGYEWMVDRIIRWGDTRCRCEWEPDRDFAGFIRCRLCGTSKRPELALAAKEQP